VTLKFHLCCHLSEDFCQFSFLTFLKIHELSVHDYGRNFWPSITCLVHVEHSKIRSWLQLGWVYRKLVGNYQSCKSWDQEDVMTYIFLQYVAVACTVGQASPIFLPSVRCVNSYNVHVNGQTLQASSEKESILFITRCLRTRRDIYTCLLHGIQSGVGCWVRVGQRRLIGDSAL
jgi:hypothetical protein